MLAEGFERIAAAEANENRTVLSPLKAASAGQGEWAAPVDLAPAHVLPECQDHPVDPMCRASL